MKTVMKIQAIATVAGVAGVIASPQSVLLNGKTTEDLERSTRKFNSVLHSKPTKGSGSGKKHLRNAGKRKLHERQKGLTREERLDELHTHSDDKMHYTKSGKVRSDGGSGMGKSGKSGSGDTSAGGGAISELFFILPTACPDQCISANTNLMNELDQSLVACNPTSDEQHWLVHADGAYVKVESYHSEGMCISVDYVEGDVPTDVEGACSDGFLTLKDCNEDFGVRWYFTGGQLVSSLCWSFGVSALMSVFVQTAVGRDNCDTGLFAYGEDAAEPILRADTFMFVDVLPESPIVIVPNSTITTDAPTQFPTPFATEPDPDPEAN